MSMEKEYLIKNKGGIKMINKIDETLYKKMSQTMEKDEENWEIKNDNDADWWIEVKGQELKEIRTYQDKLKEKIALYEDKLRKAKDEEKYIIEQRDEKLARYFETINPDEMKKTKTMLKYRLPNGELVKRYQNPQFKRDDSTLAEWLEKNNMTDYIQVKKSAKWGDLKKITEVVGDKVVTEDGEIIEGIEVVERPPKFEVKE